MAQDKFEQEIKVKDIVLLDNYPSIVIEIISDQLVKVMDTFGSESTIRSTQVIVFNQQSPKLEKIEKRLLKVKEIYSKTIKLSELIPGKVYSNRAGKYMYLGKGDLTTYRCACDWNTRHSCSEDLLKCTNSRMLKVDQTGHIFTSVSFDQNEIVLHENYECRKSKSLYEEVANYTNYMTLLGVKFTEEKYDRWKSYKITINGRTFQ